MRSEEVSKISLLLFFIAAYFVSIIPAEQRVYLVYAILLLMLLVVICRGKFNFQATAVVWLVTVIVIIFNLIGTNQNWTYFIMYLPFVMMLFAFEGTDMWMISGYRFLKYMGVFFAFFTILPLISKSLYINTIYPLLLPNNTIDILGALDRGMVSGFTYQTAINAQYLSVGIGAMILPILLQQPVKRKWLTILIAVTEVFCLIMTSKRGHLLFTALSVFLIVFLNSKKSKRFVNVIRIVSIVFLVGLIIYYFVPAADAFFERVIGISAGDDISNGRFVRYEYAWKLFKENPITGIGWLQYRYSYVKYSDTHNIYLQLLCETGIIGFSVFFVAFTISLKQAIKKLLYFVEKEKNESARLLLSFSVFIQVLFLLYGLTGNGLYDYYIYYFYAFAVAISTLYPVIEPGRNKRYRIA